ncbi:MAG: hypothetical protein ABI723_12415 [Bacteroidia bacterium]
MIKYLKHTEINKSKWDATIKQSHNGLIYAYSWYLDIASPGWEALINEDYKEVFPITGKKKYGIDYIYPPFFIQQLGLFSSKEINKQNLNDFLNAVPSKFKFIEYNLNWKNNFLINGFESKENLTHHLSLNNNYEKLYSAYSQNLKRNLKKAAASNLVIEKNIDASVLIKIFRAHRGADIAKLKTKNYETLIKLIDEAKRHKAVEIIGVNHNNNICAGAVFLKSNNKFIFIFSAADETAKATGAMPFLIDYFIKENAATANVLDFEGSNNIDLARFYKGFGAEEKIYLSIKRNNLPAPFKWLK